jgi:hypothetical protein|nr:MAG TPA: hypothetical protein [Microviridae sp.]
MEKFYIFIKNIETEDPSTIIDLTDTLKRHKLEYTFMKKDFEHNETLISTYKPYIKKGNENE